MNAEAGVDYDLFFAVWLCEFDEEDLGGEVVDLRDAEGEERILEFVGNDLSVLEK